MRRRGRTQRNMSARCWSASVRAHHPDPRATLHGSCTGVGVGVSVTVFIETLKNEDKLAPWQGDARGEVSEGSANEKKKMNEQADYSIAPYICEQGATSRCTACADSSKVETPPAFVNERGSQCTCEGKEAVSEEKEKKKKRNQSGKGATRGTPQSRSSQEQSAKNKKEIDEPEKKQWHRVWNGMRQRRASRPRTRWGKVACPRARGGRWWRRVTEEG